MDKIKNIMFIGVTFVLYTGCGDFPTPGKKSIYEMVAQRETEIYIKEEKVKHEELKETFKEEPFNESERYDKKYNQLVKQYKFLEDNLKSFKDFLERYPLAILFGGINYAMTLDEMKQKIKARFSAMKKNGLIISRDEFKKVEKNYFTVKPDQDLSRIWGGEYFIKEISKSKYLREKYDVPNYVIVADDPNHIKIKLDFDIEMFPMAITLENATIYFVKIVGIPSALSTKVKKDLSETSFNDFSSEGNIILDNKTGKYYVVDTEFKSFEWEIKSKRIRDMLEYTQNRFLYLNNNMTNYIYDIDLRMKK